MDKTEKKTSATNPEIQKKPGTELFFKKEREDSFFSDGNRNTQNENSPFFSPTKVQKQLVQRKPIFESQEEGDGKMIQEKSIDGLTVQRQGTDSSIANPGTPTSEPAQSNNLLSGQFIVSDQDTPGPGQMTKTTFLNQLNAEVCKATDEALSGTPFTSQACPYIRQAFARHRKSSPKHLENVLQRYEPQSLQVTTAKELINTIRRRTYQAVNHWKGTGDLSGVPSEIAAKIPASLTMMARASSMIGNIGGSIASGIASVGANLASGIGNIASSIGNMFFKGRTGGAQTNHSPESVMNSLGTGQSMDSRTRSNMEGAFGSDFSNVQIHTDSNAAGLSKDMNAKAFAVGNHVAFGSGEYQPGSLVGDALIAHELAHVQQQKGATGGVQQKMENGEVNKLEQEADQSALEAVSGIHGMEKGGLRTKLSKSGLQLRTCKDDKKKAEPKKGTQFTIGGEPNPVHPGMVIRIAWTFDDGPTPASRDMKAMMEKKSKTKPAIPTATWYIQHDYYLANRSKNKEFYQKILAAGGEMAFHSVHPKKNHASWFPSDEKASADSIDESIKHLDAFDKILKEDKIGQKIKFVRLPYGLHTELIHYLNKKKVAGADSVARAIIKGQSVSGEGANTVKKDFEKLKTKLNSKGLHLWGGTGKDKISNISWEAETAGVFSGRGADNTTKALDPNWKVKDGDSKAVKEKKKKNNAGKFERRVDQIVKEKKPGSYVVLAHDTSSSEKPEEADDVQAVEKDIAAMEAYAKKKGVKIEYHTMSSMFQTVVGKNP